MRKHSNVLSCSLFLMTSLATPAVAGQQDDKALKKDLTAVIALQGMPCDEVIEATMQAKNDYAATCKDGNKYRVYENDKGRVIVTKR
jgi:hypothetical protein